MLLSGCRAKLCQATSNSTPIPHHPRVAGTHGVSRGFVRNFRTGLIIRVRNSNSSPSFERAETTGWSRGTTCAQPPALSAEARATHHAQAHSVYALVDARIALPISFFQKKFKPIGACSGYGIASLCLPGHLIPATFFNDFSSLPATYVPSSLSFFSWFGCFINWATQIAA